MQGTHSVTPLTIDDRLFLGEGLFETLKVIDSKPCYSFLHWQRLQESASFLGIPFAVSYDSWEAELTRCIAANKLEQGGVKILLSGGAAKRGLTALGEEPQLLFISFQYSLHVNPIALVSATWLRDSSNPIYRVKSINYLEAIIARRQAEALGADEVLFFNLDHHATDTSVANLFIIKDNQLLTPPLDSGVLPGIIRHRLLALAKLHGLNCFEQPLFAEDLSRADGVFVCNSLQGILEVSSFNGEPLPGNNPLISLLRSLLLEDQS